MAINGFIPLNGTVDGSEFGAVLKIKWGPAFSEGWLQNKRVSLGFESDGETPRGNENVSVHDLPGHSVHTRIMIPTTAAVPLLTNQ